MTQPLQVFKLNKSYPGHRVLSNIGLDVAARSIHGLVGLNGAGKTTLLKCILNLQSPDSGEIHVQGQAAALTRARADLVYLPERFAAPDYMDGWTYLKFIADIHQRAHQRDQMDSAIRSICARLDFAVAALDKPVQALSKGMLQKLAIAGCLLSGKKLLILDEPMSGLDPKARVLFRKLMEELRGEGKTVLLCSHILHDIETLCDRVTVLHEGVILFTGTPHECRERYRASDFESAFLKCIENH